MQERTYPTDNSFSELFVGGATHPHNKPAKSKTFIESIAEMDRYRRSAAKSPKAKTQPSHVLIRRSVKKPFLTNVLAVVEAPTPVYNLPVAAPAKSLKFSRLQLMLIGMAVFVFVLGVSASLQTLLINHKAATGVAALTRQVQKTTGGKSSGSVPSSTKPAPAAVSSYNVAPSLPRYMDIPKLGVHARVLSLGVLSSGALAAPGNVFDTGWYNASAQPGQPGAMLIDGHISNWTTKGVFYGLNKLVAGDSINITRGDGKLFTYTVVKTQLFNASSVDMASLLVSVDTSKPGLNLISCSGDVIPGTNDFNERLAVYAVEN